MPTADTATSRRSTTLVSRAIGCHYRIPAALTRPWYTQPWSASPAVRLTTVDSDGDGEVSRRAQPGHGPAGSRCCHRQRRRRRRRRRSAGSAPSTQHAARWWARLAGRATRRTRTDQQPVGVRKAGPAHLVPPSADRRDGELGGVSDVADGVRTALSTLACQQISSSVSVTLMGTSGSASTSTPGRLGSRRLSRRGDAATADESALSGRGLVTDL